MDAEGVRNGRSCRRTMFLRRPPSHRRLPFRLLTLLTLLLIPLIPTTALAQGGAIRGTVRSVSRVRGLAPPPRGGREIADS